MYDRLQNPFQFYDKSNIDDPLSLVSNQANWLALKIRFLSKNVEMLMLYTVTQIWNPYSSNVEEELKEFAANNFFEDGEEIVEAGSEKFVRNHIHDLTKTDIYADGR